jgi:hypothetical protein
MNLSKTMRRLGLGVALIAGTMVVADGAMAQTVIPGVGVIIKKNPGGGAIIKGNSDGKGEVVFKGLEASSYKVCTADRSTCQNFDVSKTGVLKLMSAQNAKNPKRVEFVLW